VLWSGKMPSGKATAALNRSATISCSAPIPRDGCDDTSASRRRRARQTLGAREGLLVGGRDEMCSAMHCTASRRRRASHGNAPAVWECARM
jgi:hypothetical protein